MRALKRFPYLESALSRIATHTVARLHLEGPDGHFTLIESDTPAALMVRRVEFDALLVDLAREAGVEVLAGVEIVRASMSDAGVTLEARDGRRFDAPIVIAADGVHSVIARRLGINPGWPSSGVALDMMEETPRHLLRESDPSTLWVAYGYSSNRRAEGRGQRAPRQPEQRAEGTGQRAARNRAAEGYAYVFPKRDHVNVGVGYVLDHYRKSINADPYDLQRDFIDHLRARQLMTGDSVRDNFTPFIIPVGGPLRKPGRGRVLVAGDAAGFVNGFTAEGIYYAMVSGDLAGRAIVETPPGATATLAERYRRFCDEEIGAELRDSVLLQRYLFADRRRIARVIDGACRRSDLTRLVLDFAMGRLPYRPFRRRMLQKSPLLAARLLWARLA
jgi:flavin-dependent dehydrogenase